MKILNINSYYYSSSVHRHLQNAIQGQGIDSISYVPLAKGYIPRDECKYEYNEHVVISECYNAIDRYIFHVKHTKILREINKQINLLDFDCLHAHSLFSYGYISMKINEKLGIPYMVAVRDTDVNTFFKYMVHLRSMGIKILERSSSIIFLSPSYRNFLIQKYVPKRIRETVFAKSMIIPNGIDGFWLRNKNYSKKMPNNKTLKLLYVGTISKRKNLITTVKTAQLLREIGYDAILTVVGEIIDRAIFNQIKDLPYVNYINPMPKENLIKIYRENDIFIMPSITETFGLVYAEAMSQGLPIIYTKGQGFDGQFEDGVVGYSVNCYDAQDIANKVISILDKYEECSRNCIELCNKFDWDKIATTYTKVYKDILNKN